LANYDSANIEHRVRHLALGKSDPKKLAEKVVALKKSRALDTDLAEDEKVWCEAMLLKLPKAKAAPAPPPAPVKPADGK
jgi:hypothetical protein